MDHPYLQRRYLLSFESRRLPHIFTDVLIVGGGVAGLRAAIEAANAGAQVIVTTKARLAESNSYYAQGGLAAVLDAADDIERHVADTLAAGAGTSDEAVVRHVIAGAPACVRELADWGVRFDREGGDLSLGREGGHTANRIIHANGDATGKALVEAMIERARAAANVKIFEECFVVDLLTDPPAGGGAVCVGAITFHPRYGLQIIRARRTILAAGGAGVLWRETTNPSIATADGIAMAFRAGAAVADVEMMQFHPTVLYVAGATRSLISEAVRGEGGILVDRHGKRIMDGVHAMGDLAPRDVVSRAILERMVETGSTHVFLDVRHLGAEAFAKRFPQIDRRCREFGIDPGRDAIPVHPAAHYMIGGAKVDMNGQTSVAGLLACGEAACTGLHGANRLASNSLTEALVFGRRCGQAAAAAGDDDRLAAAKIDWTNPRSERTQLDLADIRNSLRSILWRNVGIARRGERLAETLEIIQFWGRYVLDKEFFDPAGWEIQNMLTSAYLLTEAALRRTETRGVHYRSDFPDTDPVWARHQVMRRTEYQLVVE
ncbi:MAG: L-aspartate oxidase [Planctomycetota bacterium]|nr:L-aspartate oxidase [Planctomycetota bacterium]